MNKYILAKAGIDVAEGIERFENNQDMYEEFLLSFKEEKYYQNILDAIDKNDVKQAFQAAHALKGVAGNLSLNRLYETVVPLADELRAGHMDHLDGLLESIEKSYQEVMDVLKTLE